MGGTGWVSKRTTEQKEQGGPEKEEVDFQRPHSKSVKITKGGQLRGGGRREKKIAVGGLEMCHKRRRIKRKRSSKEGGEKRRPYNLRIWREKATLVVKEKGKV